MKAKISPEERRQIAERLQISDQYLYQCLTGRRDMSPGAARRLEVETSGRISRQMVCQKTWEGIWPELQASSPAPQATPC